MELSNSPLEFDSEDSALFREFLKTRSGERLIPKLLESIPTLLASGDVNAILIRSGEVRGFQEAARTLLALAYPGPTPVKPANEWPSLEDDLAWADGQKTQPNT